MNPDEKEKSELKNKILGILTRLEIARILLADALNGNEHDPSWCRPKPINKAQIRDKIIEAHAIVQQIVNDASQ